MKLNEEELALFELAFLLGMPVYKLLDEMPYEEFLGWSNYFERRPYGWREDRRASLILKAFGGDINEEVLFPSLAVISAETRKQAPVPKKGSTMFAFIQSAIGGEHLKE